MRTIVLSRFRVRAFRVSDDLSQIQSQYVLSTRTEQTEQTNEWREVSMKEHVHFCRFFTSSVSLCCDHAQHH